MKKFLVFSLLFIPVYYCFAQQCPENVLGTKTLYKPHQTIYHVPPAGYKPVFINHAGRHGARHLTNEVNASLADSLLKKASEKGMLTNDGKRLWRMTLALKKVEKNKAGFISDEGAKELEGIGERMYMNNKTVFSSGSAIRPVMVTKEIRTHQSATAFLKGIEKKHPSKKRISQYINDTLLRFYDLAPSYRKFDSTGDWRSYFSILKNALKYDSIALAITKRFFRPAFIATLKPGQPEKFVGDIAGFLTIVPSLRKEIRDSGYSEKDLAFYSLFSCLEMHVMEKKEDAQNFLIKAAGTDSMGIQVRIAAPLLVDFITAIDTFLMKGKQPVVLRFAHAETIAPFAALLDIDSASTPAKSIIHYDKVWNAARVAPLSANIQWILYQKAGSKDYLVRILLNEKEVRINGLPTADCPFYSWDELRAFYIKKLTLLNCLPGDDMYEYLQTAK
jgi:multiple inositol-polyphosphate phosphatase/2,3-bisphosphoglycerate 3-phosphatase